MSCDFFRSWISTVLLIALYMCSSCPSKLVQPRRLLAMEMVRSNSENNSNIFTFIE